MNIQDVHHKYNHVAFEALDPMHKRSLKYINIIVISPNLMENVEGCKLLEINKVIATDYRALIIDINLKQYI